MLKRTKQQSVNEPGTPLRLRPSGVCGGWPNIAYGVAIELRSSVLIPLADAFSIHTSSKD